MSDEINVIEGEGSGEETLEPRPLEILLKLETYQGMTDVEIQMVMDYMINDAYGRGVAEANTSAIAQSSKIMAESQLALADHARATFDTLINEGLGLQTVEGV